MDSIRMRYRRWSRWLVLLIGLGCVDIQGPVPPSVAASDVFSTLRFSSNAMFIQQGESLPLSLEAVASDGSPIQVDIQNVVWVSGDSNRVSIDSTGHVIGRVISSNPVSVTARYTHASTTRSTTILVYVTAERLTASSLKMVALDSTRVGGVGNGTPNATYALLMPRIRLDLYEGDILVQTGVQLPVTVPTPFYVSYVPTGGPSREPVYLVGNGGSGLKRFWIKGAVNLYGAIVRDSLEFEGLYPVSLIGGGISVTDKSLDATTPSVQTGEKLQQPCAFVTFLVILSKARERPVEIVFSDSTAGPDDCSPISESVIKAFTQAGVRYINAVGGNVLVKRESTDIPQALWVTGIRRSATLGEISWYVRDAVTKERLPIEGKFTQIQTQ